MTLTLLGIAENLDNSNLDCITKNVIIERIKNEIELKETIRKRNLMIKELRRKLDLETSWKNHWKERFKNEKYQNAE